MTDREFDALLRRALTDNVRARQARVFAAGLPQPRYSRRYLRWEKKLLADPFSFARRQARPVWKKTLQTAAGILLCFAVLFGAVMAVSPAARAWVVDRVIYWMEDFTRFRFYEEEAQGLSASWRPAYIPEGFVEMEADWSEDAYWLYLIYENSTGEKIVFDALPAEHNFSFNVDNEHSDYHEIEINGQPASLFVSNTEGYPSYLIWSSSDQSTAFQISANISTNEMLKIAENAQ